MQRISGVFKNFMRLHNYNPTEQVAVAVSGGSDSLALAVATQSYFNPESIHILTVDHRIRNESTTEANHVREMLEKHDFHLHKILTIKWPFGELPPINKLEVRGRTNRYELLLSYCQLNNIKILLTAHHHFDKLETCLHRFYMGSSLDGLHGMLPRMTFETHPEVAILRPFLEEKKEDLQLICSEKGLKWVTDPTNYSPVFNRSCLRHILTQNKTLANDLSSVVSFCNGFCAETNSQVTEFLRNHSVLDPIHGYYCVELSKFFELPAPIAIRVMTCFMNFFSKNLPTQRRNFVTRISRVAYNKLRYEKGKQPFVKGILEYFVIATSIPAENKLYFGKASTQEKLQIKVGETLKWDNRFLITLSQTDANVPLKQNNFTIRTLKRTDQKFLFRAVRRVKAAKLPLIYYRLSLPIVVTDNDQIAIMPHFGYKDFDLNIDCKCQFIPPTSSIHTIPSNPHKKKKRIQPL